MRWIPAESGTRYRIEDSAFASTNHSRLHRCRDEADAPYVYKAYAQPLDAEYEVTRLIELARLGRIVDPARPGYGAVGWMVDAVLEERAVVGVVLRAAPTGFFNLGRDPRTFDRLHTQASYPPDAAVRIQVLLGICEQFACLEREGLVHGRISARKLLWRSDSAPHAYLLGCDRLRPAQTAGSPNAVDAVPTEWRDPRLALGLTSAHDIYSDRLALAGLTYRGLLLTSFAPGLNSQGALAPEYLVPPELDDRVRTLFGRAFGDLTAGEPRPTPTEWQEALSAVAAADVDRLTMADAEPDAQAGYYVNVPGTVAQQLAPGSTATSAGTRFDIMPPADDSDETPDTYQPGPLYRPGANTSQRRVFLAILGLAAIVTVLVVAVVLASRPSSPPVDTSQNSDTYPYQNTTTYTTDPGAGGDLSSDQPTDQATDTQSTDQSTDEPTDQSTDTSSPPDPAVAQQQAQAVSDLVNSSTSDHSMVAQAVQTEVGTCTNVSQGLADLQTAATDRQSELQSVQQLNVTALDNGPQLQSDLVNALQASYKADESYAAWAQGVLDNGCNGNAQPDESYASGDAYSKEADTAKSAFLQDWQSVATQFSLPVPSPGSI